MEDTPNGDGGGQRCGLLDNLVGTTYYNSNFLCLIQIIYPEVNYRYLATR